MKRKVFFSFHYERDAWRAGQVRNCNRFTDEDEFGFIDAVEWESIKKQGNDAIRRWINDQLNYTSVTVVLIGAETASREWVIYETRKSWERGNGLVGIRIHNLKDNDRKTDAFGINPFDCIYFTDGKKLSSVCKTFDWVLDNGMENFGKWIEEAFHSRKYCENKKLDDEKSNEKATPFHILSSDEPRSFHPKSPWGIEI